MVKNEPYFAYYLNCFYFYILNEYIILYLNEYALWISSYQSKYYDSKKQNQEINRNNLWKNEIFINHKEIRD